MKTSTGFTHVKSLLLSRWGLLLLAGAIYAPVFLAGQAGVCLIPPKHLKKEDYQFLALRRASFPETRLGHTKLEKNISTKEDAIAYIEKNPSCCDVIDGASEVNRLISADEFSFVGMIIGIKYTTVELNSIYSGRTVNIVFNQCGSYAGLE